VTSHRDALQHSTFRIMSHVISHHSIHNTIQYWTTVRQYVIYIYAICCAPLHDSALYCTICYYTTPPLSSQFLRNTWEQHMRLQTGTGLVTVLAPRPSQHSCHITYITASLVRNSEHTYTLTQFHALAIIIAWTTWDLPSRSRVDGGDWDSPPTVGRVLPPVQGRPSLTQMQLSTSVWY